MEFHARLEIDGVHDDVVVDVGGVHVSDHDALVALEMLRQLHAQLVRRCEVQRIIRCKRLHDVVVAAALRLRNCFSPPRIPAPPSAQRS